MREIIIDEPEKKPNRFEEDLGRGEIGEKAAKFWLEDIDFRGLLNGGNVPILVKENIINPVLATVGRINRTDSGIRWEKIPGENAGKDYIVHYPDGTEEAHEIKTDYMAYGYEIDPEDRQKNTQHIFIEVDEAYIDNLSEVKRNKRLFRNEFDGKAWYRPGTITDWYHFYIPLRDYDGEGNKKSENAYSEVTEEEIKEFERDESIPRRGALVTHMPGDFFISMTAAQLRIFLEEIAHIRFKDGSGVSDKKVGIRLPVPEIMEQIRKGQAKGFVVGTPDIYIKGGEKPEDIRLLDIKGFWYYKRIKEKCIEEREMLFSVGDGYITARDENTIVQMDISKISEEIQRDLFCMIARNPAGKGQRQKTEEMPPYRGMYGIREKVLETYVTQEMLLGMKEL